jgi:hypothetical protein
LCENFVACCYPIGTGEDDVEGITAAVQRGREFDVGEVEVRYSGGHGYLGQLERRLETTAGGRGRLKGHLSWLLASAALPRRSLCHSISQLR